MSTALHGPGLAHTGMLMLATPREYNRIVSRFLSSVRIDVTCRKQIKHSIHIKIIQKSCLSHIWDYIWCDYPNSAYLIMCFPPFGYQSTWADNWISCNLNGGEVIMPECDVSTHTKCDVSWMVFHDVTCFSWQNCFVLVWKLMILLWKWFKIADLNMDKQIITWGFGHCP